MNKKKPHPLKLAGWKMVKIPSHLLDSVWEKGNMIHVIFATGQAFTFGPIEDLD